MAVSLPALNLQFIVVFVDCNVNTIENVDYIEIVD